MRFLPRISIDSFRDIHFLTAEAAAPSARARFRRVQFDEHQTLPMEEEKKRLSANPDSFVGALEDGLLIGLAGFHRETGPKTRHKGRVWGVYVTASKRGQGLARRMIKVLLERATAIAGLEQVLLSVTTTQEAALGLYRSIGFELFATEPRALNVSGRFIDEHYLILRLK